MGPSDQFEKAKTEINKAISPIRFGASLGLIAALFEAYKLFSQNDFSALKITGVVVTLTIGGLLLYVAVLLRKESKHALTFASLAIGLGMIRWIFIDKGFSLNIMAILLLAVFTVFLSQFVRWIRVGALR